MTRAPVFALSLWMLVLVCLVPSVSLAADDEDYTRSGFYLEGTLVPAIQLFEDDLQQLIQDETGASPNLDFQPGFGPKLIAGYRVVPFLAAQAQISWLGAGFRSNTQFDDVQVKTWNFSGDLKAYPLPGRIEPYALVGVGMLFTDTSVESAGRSFSDSGVMARFGGGVDMWISEYVWVGFGLNYVMPRGDVETFDYLEFDVFKVGVRF